MAGHSKWANIKFRKQAQDLKRSKIFAKLIRNIMIAVKEDGPNPETNPRLRLAIQNAKNANMPKDTIQRAIEKAAGSREGGLQEVFYEAFAPHGVGLIIHCQTDNPRHTLTVVRTILTKNGGTLAASGATSHLFEPKSVFTIVVPPEISKEELILECIENGAEDVVDEGDTVILYAPENALSSMNEFLNTKNVEIKKAAREMVPIPGSTVTLNVQQALSVLRLIEKLEEEDDVEAVYHNLEITDEIAQALENASA